MIGDYLDLPKIENLDNFLKNKNDTSVIIKEMRKQSDLVMVSLAKMMPIEKRGIWQDKV